MGDPGGRSAGEKERFPTSRRFDGRGPAGQSRRGINVAGILVRADVTLLVIAALLAWSFWQRYSSVASRWGALVMALVATGLFLGSILAHELAHALEARRRGLRIRDITLYIFGGATRMIDEAARPGDQFALTAVGPGTSIVLGCAFGLISTGAGHLRLPAVAEVAGELGWLNIALGIFNLLPGAPLDGGRILDSVVWRVTRDRARGARTSAMSGQVIGAALAALGVAELLFLAGGFVGGLWLMLIGWFLVRAAAAERRIAEVRDRLRGRRIGDVAPPVPEVPMGAPLVWVVETLLRHGSTDVVGIAGPEGLVGALTVPDLRNVRSGARSHSAVQDVMTATSALPTVQADAPAVQLLPLLGAQPVAVVKGDRVSTLITAHQLDAALEWLRPLPPTPDGRPADESPDGARQTVERSDERSRTPGSRIRPRRASSIVRFLLFGTSGAILLAAVGVVPMPLVELTPGPALDVPGLLHTGGPVHPVSGRLLLTSVRLDAPSIAATVRAVLDSHREVVGRTSVVPSGIDPVDYEASQRELFTGSVRLASAVALRAAGYPVTIRGGGAVVRAVGSGSPARGVLVPGDVVLAMTGQKVDSAADLIDHLSAAPLGGPVRLDVRRGDRKLAVEVSPVWSGEADHPVLDIVVEDAAPLVQLPFDVHVARKDLGGPSAGLMTALAVYAVTTGSNLTGGHTVAGTGTIDAEGKVGPVGGIPEKVAGASAAGAKMMLVPASEAASARRAAAGLRIEVVPVSSFSTALGDLRSLPSR